LKSNIVVIGDINTHDGNRWPATDTANNIPKLSYWTGVVGDFERGNVRTYTDGQGVSRTTSNPRPGLRVKTFLFDVNEYGNGSDADNRQYRKPPARTASTSSCLRVVNYDGLLNPQPF
jgi:type IV pilus assembly protein PilY1